LAGLLLFLPPATAQAPEDVPGGMSSGGPVGAAAVEEVSAFTSNLEIGADGWLGVTETVNYSFPEPRHGIYRDLPVVYEIDGKRWRSPLEVTSVTDGGGTPMPFTEETNGYFLRLKIGRPDQTVTGLQQYVIRYRVAGVVRHFEDHDELYWNVTGHEWTAPLRRVTATVRLAEGLHEEDTTAKCYTGPVGSTDEDCLIQKGGGVVSFAASGPLTVVVGFTPGIVALLPLERVRDWTPLAFPLPLLALAIMLTLWRRYGRDPAGRGTHVVQYDPPDKLPPAMVGVIADEQAHQHDVAAMIVNLAVRGYLKIVETERQGIILKSRDYDFVRLKDYAGDTALLPHECAVLDGIFGGLSTVSLAALKENHAFNLALKGIKEKVYDDCVAGGYFPKSPLRIRTGYLAAAGILAVLAFVLFQLTAFLTVYAGLSAALPAVIVGVFGWFMPRRTAKGVAAREHALGFKDYLATAEKYRLQWQESENVFEKFLPYAMVFGVAEKWSKAFADIGLRQPTWYEGRPGMIFNAVVINDVVSSMNRSLVAAMNSAPQKTSGGSGFSGGFSGGGFGGGGGGSW
jgi:hypothetical protein